MNCYNDDDISDEDNDYVEEFELLNCQNAAEKDIVWREMRIKKVKLISESEFQHREMNRIRSVIHGICTQLRKVLPNNPHSLDFVRLFIPRKLVMFLAARSGKAFGTENYPCYEFFSRFLSVFAILCYYNVSPTEAYRCPRRFLCIDAVLSKNKWARGLQALTAFDKNQEKNMVRDGTRLYRDINDITNSINGWLEVTMSRTYFFFL